MVLRSVSLFTYLLPLGLVAFGGAFALARTDDRDASNAALAVGWLLLAGFWLAVARTRLIEARPFLGITALVAAGIFGYVASLALRDHASVRRLSWAFFVMGGLYTPFQLVEPIHQLVVAFVATSTSLGLDAMGYVSLVQVGTAGNQNEIVVAGGPGEPPVTMSILSACTGISAIALFAGLIAAADCSPRRRLVGILVFTPIIFALNVVRNVFTIAAYREHTFAFLAGMELPFVAPGNSPQFSYYVAEQVIAPVYIVVGTVIVYKLVSAEYPSVDRTIRTVVETMATDANRALGLVGSRGGVS